MTIFLDSWVWIEFFIEGEKFEKCKEVLVKIKEGRQNAIMSAFSIVEIKYRLSAINEKLAHEQIHIIEAFPNLTIVPVVVPVAKLAADLRRKYYSKERQVSYGDMLHLATAILTGCTALYSGDPDFKDVDEVKTVIV